MSEEVSLKNVLLMNNHGYAWHEQNGIFVKGYAFDSEDNCFEADGLVQLFRGVTSVEDFEGIVKHLNGLFSVVIKTEESFFLAVDITRTFPLFYSKQNGEWIISDDANILNDKYQLRLDKEAEEIFKCTGYVTGNKTLLENVNQVQAAEVIQLSDLGTISREYWLYLTTGQLLENFEQLGRELSSIFDLVAKRLIRNAKGKTIVIPLSGGYDSRLIAIFLKQNGYKNVICYTYGKKSCYEAKQSKVIANKLGFKWLFIEYTDKLIQKNLSSREWLEFIKFSGNYTSIPHFQDFIAVKQLKDNQLIPADCFFVPGHSGDIFAGTHIGSNISNVTSYNDIRKTLNKKHAIYCNKEIDLNNQLPSELKQEHYYSFIEAWSWKERQAKFIVNSNRVYEFFDYKHLLPLWDKELADFFKYVPLEFKNRRSIREYKIDSNLYDFVAKSLFDQHGVYNKKSFLENFFPRLLCKIFNLCKQKDCLNFLTMKKVLGKNMDGKDINSTTIQYYLTLIKK